MVDKEELAGLLVFGPSLGVLLQIRIDVRSVKSPAISILISLDPTDESSSSWVGPRLVVDIATNVFFLIFFLFLLLLRDIVS